MSSSPYSPAARILNLVFTKRKGLKNCVYSKTGELTCSTATYAQCSNALQHKPVLDFIVQECKFQESSTDKQKKSKKKSTANNIGLLYILIFELLLGPNRKIRGGGALKRLLISKQKDMEAAIKVYEKKHGPLNISQSSFNSNLNKNKNLSKVTIPRYVRINSLKGSPNTIVQEIQTAIQEQYTEKSNNGSDETKTILFRDEHVPNMLVLPATPKIRGLLQPWVLKHQIVLQDKSSCFSALCLVHGFGQSDDDDGDDKSEANSNLLTSANGDCLDACAAPGNKTSHLAALLHETSPPESSSQTPTKSKKKKKRKSMDNNASKMIHVHALDQSPDRFKLLQRRMNELANNDDNDTESSSSSPSSSKNNQQRVQCHHSDFLKTTQADFDRPIQAILLDPSCSGSGMTTNHLELSQSNEKNSRNGNNDEDAKNSSSSPSISWNDPKYRNDRVIKLSHFQIQVLKHAMNSEAFPHVQRIVYSTCSLYIQENENVVSRILQEKEDSSWALTAPTCLSHWKRRGIATKSESDDDDNDNDEEQHDGYEERLSGLTKEQADCLIRVDPQKDATNGFFVACFQKEDVDNSNSSNSKSSLNTTIENDLVLSLPVYKGEFHKELLLKHKKEQQQQQQKQQEASSKSPTKDKKMATESNDENTLDEKSLSESSKKKKKRKNPSSILSEEKLSKKRAKKLEWKQRQHEQKMKRLQKK